MSLRIAALVATVAAGLLLVTSAGAGTTVGVPRVPDLSTMTKIRTYLRSIGVNPATVVIQRGTKNYAGPNCPGAGWTCTTRTRVLQVGSQNTMECTDDTCVGLNQTGDRNTFRCIWKTSDEPAVQRCSVTQTGSWNYALFEQVADQSSSTDGEQDATQIAEVHQQGTGLTPKNELHVFQRVKQSMTTAGAQKQDAHQVVKPAANPDVSGPPFTNIQDASGAGNNYADINQYIDQRGSGAATSQQQNVEPLGTDPPAVADCVVTTVFPIGPTTPNQCVEGSQSTGTGGQNYSQLHLLIDQDARSTENNAQQTQGAASGGIDARVHQRVGGVTGSSNSHANTAMRQNVAGATGSVQVQIDPTSCCGISQEGGMNNSQNIDEASAQNSDEVATQSATLIGECDTQEGSCSVQHHGKNDSANESFSASCDSDPATEAPPCPIVLTTLCNSESAEGGGSAGACGPPPSCSDPPCVELTGPSLFTATNSLPGTPLSGFEVTMGLVEPNLSPLPLLR